MNISPVPLCRSLIRRAGIVLALLGLAAAPVRLEAQCTLASSPVAFEPNPPGASRLGSLSSGFSTSLALYRNGAGSPRILMFEAWGYSTLDIASNPGSPSALKYDDLRLDPNNSTTNQVPAHGDGQSYIQTVGISPDGQRIISSVNGPAEPDWHNLVGKTDGGEGFGMWGDFGNSRASGTVVQQAASRYIAYAAYFTNPLVVSDVTTLPAAFSSLNLASETTSLGPGYAIKLAGNYVLYLLTSGAGLQIIDASTPGPAGNIASGFKTTTLASVPGDPYSRVPRNYTAAVDPQDPTKLWILVEVSAQTAAGENSPSYALVSITKDGNGNFQAPVSAGALFRVPSVSGETWGLSGGSSSLVASNGQLFAIMWATRSLPTQQFVLYSSATSAWAPSTPVIVNTSGFGLSATAAAALAGTGTNVYQYLPTGSRAFVVPLTCQPVNAPASSSLTVTNAGIAVPDGGTAYLGDTLTIVPTVVPSPASKPLSDWRFDFDFHAGNPLEDAGTQPRIVNLDNDQFGSPASPPASITLVGPCDPRNGGVPASGAACWNSVLTNAAVGGPDFVGNEAPGQSKPLKLALEATNQFGSSNTAVFTVNWKVPTAKIASTQVLSGQPLTSASDGQPIPAGFKWYFGATPTTLAQAACTGTTCVPTLDTKGTYYYYLTASYANGYVTPDYDGVTNVGHAYTVTDFAPIFTVNGSATGPITAVINQNVTITNSSQRGATVTASGGFFYNLCQVPCGADNWVLFGTMGDAPPGGSPPTAATIQAPGVAGSYQLKLKVNYTGGTAYWPDPNNVTAFPISVTAATPKIRIYVNGQDPCPPGPFCLENQVNAHTGDTLTAYSYVNGARDTGTVVLNWNFPGASPQFPNGQGSNFSYGTAGQYDLNLTRDGAAYSFPGAASITVKQTVTPLNVTASASPRFASAGTRVTLSCSASGGTGTGYQYSWTGVVGGPFSTSPSFSFNATNGSSTDVTTPYYCTVTDSAQASSYATALLTVYGSAGPPGPTCTNMDFQVRDLGSNTVITRASNLGLEFYQVQTGQNLQFEPLNGPYASTAWTFGDGGSSSATPAQHFYTAGGQFQASLAVTPNSGVTLCNATKSYPIFVTGPTAQFSASYEDATSITYSKVTAFKSITFSASDLPSQVDAYSWEFGDNTAHGSGATVTHGFAPGSFTVKLTVTKGSASASTTLALTVVPPPEPPKWVVPGMAYVLGQVPGTVWQSDVTIFNPDPTRSATYAVAFLDARNPVDDYSKLTFGAITVPPLGSVSSPNLLGDAFGQALGAYGGLLVRGDVAPLPPVITARTFNNGDPAKGTFGLSVPSTSVSGGVSTQASPAASVLIGLHQNDSAYTNLGLVNLKNDWPKVQLDFFDGDTGDALASRTVDMMPYQSLQITRALADAGFTGTSDLYTIRVKILQGTAVYPFASVIDVNSTDPIVVTPADAPSDTYRVPGMIRLTGANGELWRSRFTISNPSAGAARRVRLVFSYRPCDATGCGSLVSISGDITMNPGQTMSQDDFTKFWLNEMGHIPVDDRTSIQDSFLDVSPSPGDSNSDPLVVLGETYNATSHGHVGLQIPGYTPLDGASRAGAYKRLALTGLASTAAYRTNLALMVVGGTTGKWVGVHVYSPSGVDLRDLPVFVDGVTQVSNAALFGALPGDLSRLSVVVDNIDDGVTIARIRDDHRQHVG